MRCTNLKMKADAEYKMGKAARLRAKRIDVEVELATRVAQLEDKKLRLFLTGMQRLMKIKEKRSILANLRHKNGGRFTVVRQHYKVFTIFEPNETPGPFTLEKMYRTSDTSELDHHVDS